MKYRGFLLIFVFSYAMAYAQPDITAIRCGHLIDPRTGTVIDNAVILVEGKTVKEVGSNVSIPAGASVIDLSTSTVLPGFIDAHTHVLLQGDITADDYADQLLKESTPYRTLRAAKACKISLLNGFTTLRDVETEGAMYADVDLKKAIERGIIDGPRLFVSTRAINTTGHYSLSNKEYSWELHLPKGIQEITGADEARRAVREQISHGADWIKIYADRSYYQLPDGSFRSYRNFSDDEIMAIGDEVRAHKKKLAAHAVTRDGILHAIQAGASSIEHGDALDDECIEQMVEKGIFWCPTIYVTAYVAEGRAKEGNPIFKLMLDQMPKVFRKALDAGVKIAFGTDAGGYAWTENQAKEFTYLVEWGMTPMRAIQAATTVAAELLDMTGKIGEISPGSFADIVAVHGDPLQDISVLQNVDFVMKEGVIYKNARGRK